MEEQLLTSEAVEAEFKQLPLEWTLLGGTELSFMRKLEDFAEAMKYVNEIAQLAENANHHPNISINYNKVELTLTTHSASGLTIKDFELAKAIAEIS